MARRTKDISTSNAKLNKGIFYWKAGYKTQYSIEKLGLSEEEIQKAIYEIGKSRKKLEQYLKKRIH